MKRRTTSLRMSDVATPAKTLQRVFDGTDKRKWEHHQYKYNATTAKSMQTI
jgi:hypothetical protein